MEEQYPDVYDFITLRRETYGGFLYNPFLYAEVFLDDKAFRVMELCNGSSTVTEITSRLSSEFDLDSGTSAIIVRQSLEKGNGQFAIHWRSTRRHGATPIEKPKREAPGNSIEFFHQYYSAPNSVIFEVTRECNLSCKHCLVSAGNILSDELTLDEVFRILDQLKEMKAFTVNFGGGEPFMRKDFMDILRYASSKYLGIIISTNGYFIDDTILDQLEDIKAFSVQISVDGLRNTHDRFRGREGSFNKAVTALRKFSDRGYHTTMSTMIMKSNIGEMGSLIDLCIENQISMFKLSSFMPAGRGASNANNHTLTGHEMRELARFMQQQKENHSAQLLIDDKATYPFLLDTSPSPVCGLAPVNEKIGCSAARATINIGPDGTVYPCPFLTRFPAGNLKHEKLSDIWTESPSMKIFRDMNSRDLKGKCRNCSLIPGLCQGGCRAAAYLHSGDIYAEDPFCWISS
ncbi:MAG: radical SAM protein [Bacteroidales bacterium]|nr:radical SAM protein [Bacteroidales bacterium]